MESYSMPGHLIRRLNQRSSTVFNQTMLQHGFDITSVQFAAMEALHGTPDIEQAQLASLIFYDRATIGSVVDRLEQKGYLQRNVSPKDKRAKICRLTTLGEDVLQKTKPVVRALQKEITEGLTSQETAQFLVLAKKILQKAPN
jgi:DNA-binding MarR family transcriptional regulator